MTFRNTLTAAAAVLGFLAVAPVATHAAPFTESPTKITSVDIDENTGEVRVNTMKAKVHDDFLDADRDIVVGQKIRVDEPVFENGVVIGRKVGWAWQSLSGKWHYDVKIIKKNATGGTDSTQILRMMPLKNK